jgi:hypothetical protein
MTTIGDKLVDIWHDYFAVTTVDVADPKKTKLAPTEFSSILRQEGYIKLTPERRREIFNECALLQKGIKKKSLDTFMSWFILEGYENRNKPAAIDTKILREFELRSNYRYKLYEAKVASHIYGNGYLLISFKDDESTPISEPPKPTSEPWDVTVLNSEYLTELKYFNDAYKAKGILHYYYYGEEGKEFFIHPSRIQHITANKVPGHRLGISTIDILRHTMFSKKNVDIAAGHILAWFSHGILDITLTDAEPEERDAYLATAEKHPGAWAHDEGAKLEFHNPTAINPKPFYDYIVMNIAAALNMPTHVLTGIQVGRVTGAEIGFTDYYKDVVDEQILMYTPLISSLYERILLANGRMWKYTLAWNTIYVDEMSEAKLLELRVNSANTAISAGIIDVEEARHMVNKGQIELDISKQIKRPAPHPSDRQPKDPTGDREPKKEEMEMIARCEAAKKKALQKLIDAEKELGKAILDEQEKNDTDSS